MLTVKDPKKQNWAEMSLADLAEGNAQDAFFTLRIFELLETQIKDLNLHHLYGSLIAPMTPIFAEIEYNGLNVDSQTLDVLNMQLDNKIKDKEFEIRALPEVSTEDNLNSTQDLVDILFTREGSFQLYPPVNTAKGKPSVNSECIDILLEQIDEELESR
jgi:DNA polymerase I-like protein with 3'-5' exonuclease and polymerase domains